MDDSLQLCWVRSGCLEVTPLFVKKPFHLIAECSVRFALASTFATFLPNRRCNKDRVFSVQRHHSFSSYYVFMPEDKANTSKPDGFLQRMTKKSLPVLLALVFGTCSVLSIGYHLIRFSSGEAPEMGMLLLYAVIMTSGSIALWTLVRRYFKKRPTSAGRVIWSVLVSGFALISIAAITTNFGTISTPGIDLPLGFAPGSGVPLTTTAIFKMVIVSLAQVLFVFILLSRIQELVLVKRTSSSQHNWYAMLFVFVAASLLSVFRAAGDPQNFVQDIAIVVSIVFMVLNAFRLSWIVSLSFKEKLATIGLCMVLIVLLIGGPGIGNSGSSFLIPDAYSYLEHYFMPLAAFVKQATIFGILYGTTSFLSLLFHLPTTGDFRQREGERATMHSLTHLIGQVFEAERLFESVAAAPVESGSADYAWLALPDLDTGFLQYKVIATSGIVPAKVNDLFDSTQLASDLSRDNLPLIIQKAQADHRLNLKTADGIGSLLAVPLTAREEVLGALFAAKKVSSGFEQDDIETISIFAAQAAVAIDNAHLFEQQVERERLEREMSIAREVQQKLLPQNVPEISGLSMAASSVSAQEVGGDYYDFVRLGEQELGVIIGDVSGKGTSAAFYMAEMQGIFHSVSRIAKSPATFLTHANTALAQTLDKNVFISAIYAILNLETERIVLARAGHCPAAIVRLNGEARYIRTRGLGLGLDRGSLFQQSLTQESISLDPGDVLVFYTDGVVESRDAEGEEYGYDRLLSILKEYRHEDADGLHSAVLRDLRGFIGSAEYDDDMTLVVVKWHGVPIDTLLTSTQSVKEST